MSESDSSAGRTKGKDAHRTNIAVVCSLADDIRSTMGPKGMDKMIVDGLGDIIVTNDGYTLLTNMRIKHPSAKLAIEAAITQQEKVGDGTTSVVVFAGELLRRAQHLLEMNIHPSLIAQGYRLAEGMAQTILKQISEPASIETPQLLLSAAQTAMTGKSAESAKDHLSRLALKAIEQTIDAKAGQAIDLRSLKLERMIGGSLDQSELLNGVLISRERAHPHMPREVRQAKIAIIEQALEIRNPEITAQIQISDPAQMQAFIEQEQRTLAEITAKLVSTGCTVVFCQQNIEEPADYFLSKAGVLAVRRVPQSDLVRIAQATGARIVTNAMSVEPEDLGFAGRIREDSQSGHAMIVVEECKDPKAVTLVIRGATEHSAEEARRAMEDAIGDIASILRDGKVVAGAGAIEIRLKRALDAMARRDLKGKERLIVETFAQALLVVPRTLIESTGQDPIEVISQIEDEHEQGREWTGFDAVEGDVADCWKREILEPSRIKAQALTSATEVAVTILRIDDMFIGDTRDRV